jgi:hypothetical protein
VVVLEEAQLQPVAEEAEEGVVVGEAVVREEMARMALLVLLEQVEQVDQAFHSRFLNTMVEMPKPMVRVEMADQTHSLVTPLEQVVRQIQVRAVQEEEQRRISHPALADSSLWAEKVVQVWSSFNIPHN